MWSPCLTGFGSVDLVFTRHTVLEDCAVETLRLMLLPTSIIEPEILWQSVQIMHCIVHTILCRYKSYSQRHNTSVTQVNAWLRTTAVTTVTTCARSVQVATVEQTSLVLVQARK